MKHHGLKPAVVLLSGGLDSTTVLAVAKNEGYALHALTFAYGQRQHIEIQAASNIARMYHVEQHHVAQVDLRAWGGSALTDTIDVPKNNTQQGIPVTYVPARNTLFLSYALAWAEVLGAYDIFIGVNAVDYSGYPDCRPAFVEAFETLANLATKAAAEGKGRFRIHAPLLHLSKAQIIEKGISLGVDYSHTHSCYDPTDTLACGACDACILRKEGFAAAKVQDPTLYVTQKVL